MDRFRGQARSIQLHPKYDLAVIEHSWCAEYLETLGPICSRVVLNMHNVESILHETCANAASPAEAFLHRRFATHSRRIERLWLPRFDAILTASELDKSRIKELGVSKPAIVYPNAIPWTPVPERAEQDAIAFSGNLEYHPNRTAVQFFAKEIWPTLSRRNPGLRWRLIGMNPSAIEGDIRGLDRVETTGPVADAIHELAAAKVVVAPLRSGSGTRLKIIEAWAAERAVVSTRLGAEGLPVQSGDHLVLADRPEEMIASIERLLESYEERRKLGIAGRRLFEEAFSWESAWRALDCCKFLGE